MAEDLGERTEEPTGRKLSDLRERGQVARSVDLTAAIDLIGVAVLLALAGAFLVDAMGRLMRQALSTSGMDAATIGSVWPLIRSSVIESAVVLVPFMLASVIIVVAAHVVQFGLLWTTQPLAPDLTRLNPITGLGRLFSTKSAIKTGVNLLKLVAVATVGWLFISARLEHMAALPALTFAAGVWMILKLGAELTAWLLAVLLVLGVLDYLYQRWDFLRDNRMTKQEVQDERRSMDGDPTVKQKRMAMARQIAMQRINSAVPGADVVVTNPTHFSVALKYDQGSMGAPRVVAKGADFLAFRIRQLAALHGVPMVERPPLARGLYYNVEVGREISPEFYQAVAEVLAYVYRLENRAASGVPA